MEVRQFVIHLTSRGLDKIGYKLLRNYFNVTNLIPPPATLEHPIDALYASSALNPTACKVPLNKCLNILGFGDNSWHPFVAFLKEYRNNNILEFKGSILEKYYLAYQPKNARGDI